MDADQFRRWLMVRGVSEDLAKQLSDDSERIKKLYADSVRIGAAIPHEEWMDELTSSAPGPYIVQVGWAIAGMMGGLFALLED